MMTRTLKDMRSTNRSIRTRSRVSQSALYPAVAPGILSVAAMIRTKRKKGFFVGFDFSSDALTEINRFFRTEHIVIVPLTVKEIVDETIAQKLA